MNYHPCPCITNSCILAERELHFREWPLQKPCHQLTMCHKPNTFDIFVHFITPLSYNRRWISWISTPPSYNHRSNLWISTPPSYNQCVAVQIQMQVQIKVQTRRQPWGRGIYKSSNVLVKGLDLRVYLWYPEGFESLTSSREGAQFQEITLAKTMPSADHVS